MRWLAVVTCVAEERIKRLRLVSLSRGRDKLPVIGKRTAVGDSGEIEITVNVADRRELWIAALLQSAALTIVS